MRTIQNVFAALILFVAMSACQKDTGIEPQPADPSSPTPQGKKAINMNSNPDNSSGDFKHFYVDIDKVDAYVEGQGWVAIQTEEQSVDLNALFDESVAKLAEVKDSVFAHIRKIRVTFGTQNYLTMQNGTSASVALLNGQEYVIDIDQSLQSESSILLNIDLNGAIVEQALGYVFNPIFSCLEDPETGVDGHVSGTIQAIVSLENGNGSLQTFLDAEGDFRLQDVDPGTYTLEIRPIIAGIESALHETRTVVVVEGQTTAVGDISFN